MKTLMGLALAAAMLGGAAHAEVTDKSAAGFEVTEKATIAAPAAKVWDALMRPDRWWSSQHSWSGDAKNLYFDPSGCFCERLKRGAVRHMTIVYNDGATTLRLNGGLGPMQLTGASGNLGITLKPANQNTELTMTYDVGGYAKGGLAETLAAPVDMVLGEQVARLKKYLETGRPD
ncbi:MAG: polyketide cyclase/dehydrase-family protein [Phenylobacterium sp.]|jgi:carbon monoxide dehydrogenase subunit G|nr:polyketide cyclase/dehydrase-family protein [Phenylobacterium sp.]